MAKYRKKPVVIEAVQWDGSDESADRIADLAEQNIEIVGREYVVIQTLEGEMVGNRGDWIIRGIKGEVYPCKPDIFAETYEPAEAA